MNILFKIKEIENIIEVTNNEIENYLKKWARHGITKEEDEKYVKAVFYYMAKQTELKELKKQARSDGLKIE